jgi:serine-type D-Ala-D-Ala carboxypeptidase (penicillin-binding protein 5/6)
MKSKIKYVIIVFMVLSFFLYLLKIHEGYSTNVECNVSQWNIEENIIDIGTNDKKDIESSGEKIKLFSTSASLLDASNNRVLYEKNGYKEMPMASTTKIMTLIITLENADLNDIVTVSAYAAKMPDVQLNIREGEQYKLGDLVYSLMLESHNDVAVAISEHVGGSVEGFAKMMNAKAKELGCKHTNFVTPNGLDADKHYTTAVELAKIASYAIKNDKFVKIINTQTWQFSEIKKGRSFLVSNKDRFLKMYEGAIGVKTGFTGKAGYCFVGAVKKGNKTFVSAVLACGWPPSKNCKWKDTTLLMDYGMNNFQLKQIFDDAKTFEPILVKDGQKNYVNLFYEGEISLLINKNEVVKVVYKTPTIIIAPVVAKTVVGSAKYYVGEDLIKEVPIMTINDVKKIDYEFCIKKIFNFWLIP